MKTKATYINRKNILEDTTMKALVIIIMLLFLNMYSSAQSGQENYTEVSSLNDIVYAGETSTSAFAENTVNSSQSQHTLSIENLAAADYYNNRSEQCSLDGKCSLAETSEDNVAETTKVDLLQIFAQTGSDEETNVCSENSTTSALESTTSKK